MRQVLKGSTDQSVVIRIVDAADGTPETGVVAATSGLDLKYRRDGAATVDITEADLTNLNDAHADGGMKHIGAGYYRLDVPDAAFASGVDGVLVFGTVTDMVVIGCYVPLVAYNPQNAVRLGLTALPNAAADAAGGLPISDAGGLDLDTMNANITTLIGVDTSYKKNVAVTAFVFGMRATDGTPGTGLTVAGEISKDGGAFAGIAGAITEIDNGFYKVDLAQAEMNADEIALSFTAGGAQATLIKIRTQS